MPDIDELMEEADERLFRSILNNPRHTLHTLLPLQSKKRRRTIGLGSAFIMDSSLYI